MLVVNGSVVYLYNVTRGKWVGRPHRMYDTRAKKWMWLLHIYEDRDLASPYIVDVEYGTKLNFQRVFYLMTTVNVGEENLVGARKIVFETLERSSSVFMMPRQDAAKMQAVSLDPTWDMSVRVHFGMQFYIHFLMEDLYLATWNRDNVLAAWGIKSGSDVFMFYPGAPMQTCLPSGKCVMSIGPDNLKLGLVCAGDPKVHKSWTCKDRFGNVVFHHKTSCEKFCSTGSHQPTPDQEPGEHLVNTAPLARTEAAPAGSHVEDSTDVLWIRRFGVGLLVLGLVLISLGLWLMSPRLCLSKKRRPRIKP